MKHDNEAKQEYIKDSSVPMLEDHVLTLADQIYHYIQWYQKVY